jgi:uncharacterized MAPEG superfamily protein
MSVVMARRLAAEGRRAWAWLCGFSVPIVFAAVAAVGFAAGTNPGAVAFLATPWVWVTALAVHLYRREAKGPSDVPASHEMRRTPVAG